MSSDEGINPSRARSASECASRSLTTMNKEKIKEEKNHARDQAAAQYENMVDMLADLEHAQECDEQDEQCPSNENNHDEEKARQAIEEDALEVATGQDFNGTRTYMILLCTGGPAVRIIGELDEFDNPDTAIMQYQDWGTPWTEFRPAEQSTLLSYAQNFYFGK